MSVIPAGSKIDYTVTYLEMTDRPGFDGPDLPEDTRLERAVAPPNWLFLSLYDVVGQDYEWVDWHKADPAELTAYISDLRVELWIAYSKGWPHGFFQLDFRTAGTCDLAYFGLVPQAIGAGLGGALLRSAILKAWAGDGVDRLTVNTCTLDHPRAMGVYEKYGFRPIRTESTSRVLTRSRDTSNFPS